MGLVVINKKSPPTVRSLIIKLWFSAYKLSSRHLLLVFFAVSCFWVTGNRMRKRLNYVYTEVEHLLIHQKARERTVNSGKKATAVNNSSMEFQSRSLEQMGGDCEHGNKKFPLESVLPRSRSFTSETHPRFSAIFSVSPSLSLSPQVERQPVSFLTGSRSELSTVCPVNVT